MWCPLNCLVCWLKQSFQLLSPSSSYLVKPLIFPVELSWCQEVQKRVQGQISKPFISGLPAGMYDLRSVDCSKFLLEFQIISLRNNNKLDQGCKEVVPVLLKTVFGSRCFDGAEVHCFLAKLNKGNFVCIHSCAHAPHFPSVPFSLRGWSEDVLLSAPNYSLLDPCRAQWVLPVTPGFMIMQHCDGAAHYLRVSFALIPQIYHGDKTSGDELLAVRKWLTQNSKFFFGF